VAVVAEKVETSAIGRALGLAGYGTEKAFEQDEDDEGQPLLADSPVRFPGSADNKSVGTTEAKADRLDYFDADKVKYQSVGGKKKITISDGEIAASSFTREPLRKAGFAEVDEWEPDADIVHQLAELVRVYYKKNGEYKNIVTVRKVDELDEMPKTA
jgi:hypothetical protein